MNRVRCPVCGRSFRPADSSGVVPEHNPIGEQFNICPGTHALGETLAVIQETAPAQAPTDRDPAPQGPSGHNERADDPPRQPGVPKRIPRRPAPASPDPVHHEPEPATRPSVPPKQAAVTNAPARADGRGCGLDITCLREHGHSGDCLPHPGKRRPPTISEVICRRKPRCTLVAGHQGECDETPIRVW